MAETTEARQRLDHLTTYFRDAITAQGAAWTRQPILVPGQVWGDLIAALDDLDKRITRLESAEQRGDD